jgi:HAD superfamily hydrolase (TIGR01662 family)
MLLSKVILHHFQEMASWSIYLPGRRAGRWPLPVLCYNANHLCQRGYCAHLIKGIIFDLGHTLIRLGHDHQEVSRIGAEAMADWYLKKKRVKLDQPALIETFLAERQKAWEAADQSWQEIPLSQTLAATLARLEAPPATQSQSWLDMALKIFYEPQQSAWSTYPDTIETLRLLKRQGYRLGLYSNADDDAHVQRLINGHKLRPELGMTFSSAGKGWRKPKPDGFALIASRWGLPAEQIVVVGDTLKADVLGAQHAGMNSILVTMDEAPSNDDHRHIQPTAVAAQLAALPELIGRM